jgi:glycosyltransferase involved in cell wall biosynthesis
MGRSVNSKLLQYCMPRPSGPRTLSYKFAAPFCFCISTMAKLLYLITEDWFFCSHFLERGRAARAAGYEVVVAARPNQHVRQIEAAGLRFVPLAFERNGINPFYELKTLFQIAVLYRKERPDLVHHIALKPVVYGALCALLFRRLQVINAPVGMGFVFSSTSLLARVLRPLVMSVLRLCLATPRSQVIFENKDDLQGFVGAGTVPAAQAHLIRGAGVNLQLFKPCPAPSGTVRILLPARMLADKGVREFVAAAGRVRAAGVKAEFVLAGGTDSNPASIPEAQLRAWHDSGDVTWLGQVIDMAALLSTVHIVCLPSYREGLPKALLEALAAGKPVVSTNVPGCREVVQHGHNGILVPARDVDELTAALMQLIEDPVLRQTYGVHGRMMAEKWFSDEAVISQTLRLYGQQMAVPEELDQRTAA